MNIVKFSIFYQSFFITLYKKINKKLRYEVIDKIVALFSTQYLLPRVTRQPVHSSKKTWVKINKNSIYKQFRTLFCIY